MTPRPRIVAALIVKNEAHIITDALRSVRGLADSWIVLDTGSTDTTIETLREFAHEFPGEVHRGPFVDFSQARNALLDLAEPRADWLILIDADMAWEDAARHRIEIERADPDPTIVGFEVQQFGDLETFWGVRTIRTGAGWRYRYRTHEVLGLRGSGRVLDTETRTMHFRTGGSRGDKMQRDLRLLTEDLREHPEDGVLHYYLGATHRDLGNLERSLVHYRRAVALGGSAAEYAYIAALGVGEVLALNGFPDDAVDHAYLEAASLRPARGEARLVLYRRFNARRRFAQVVELDRLFAESRVGSADRLYLHPSARVECDVEVARALYALGDRARFAALRRRILADPELPEDAAAVVKTWPGP